MEMGRGEEELPTTGSVELALGEAPHNGQVCP